MQFQNKISKYFNSLVFIGILINALGLFNDVLEPDSALYANIAKTIVNKQDWLNLYVDGHDWLDKPHFPFWLAAISYKIFGISAFAYKLPSFLFFLVSIFYTYRLTKKTCSIEAAQIATIVYIISLHIILCNFDVRAEIFLTACITAGIYHMLCASDDKWLKHIVIAALFTAFAIMTKGVFVWVTIGSGFIIYWLLTSQYNQFISLKWYVYVVLCLLFIFPEVYSLYKQFDIHPEKVVFGKTNISGNKFFFWDSQFGRFFNTGPIKGEGDLFFYIHTTLWAFLPWSIFLLLALIQNIRKLSRLRATKKTILYSSALFSFFMFSLSSFQLPHYIVIIFPLLAAFIANYLLCNSKISLIKWFNYIQNFALIFLIVTIALLLIYFRPHNLWIAVISIVITIFVSFFILNKNTIFNVIAKALCFSVLLSTFLNIVFYPSLMEYQAGMVAGKWQKKEMPGSFIKMYKCIVYTFEFYGNAAYYNEESLANAFKTKNCDTIFSATKDIDKINRDSFDATPIKTFPHYHITQLTPKFINYRTRRETLDSFAIAVITKKY